MFDCNTFKDKRHLLILVAITQLSTHLAIDLELKKKKNIKNTGK